MILTFTLSFLIPVIEKRIVRRQTCDTSFSYRKPRKEMNRSSERDTFFSFIIVTRKLSSTFSFFSFYWYFLILSSQDRIREKDFTQRTANKASCLTRIQHRQDMEWNVLVIEKEVSGRKFEGNTKKKIRSRKVISSQLHVMHTIMQ